MFKLPSTSVQFNPDTDWGSASEVQPPIIQKTEAVVKYQAAHPEDAPIIGERKLLLAMFYRAAADLGSNCPEEREEAREWILEDKDYEWGTFNHICEELDLSESFKRYFRSKAQLIGGSLSLQCYTGVARTLRS